MKSTDVKWGKLKPDDPRLLRIDAEYDDWPIRYKDGKEENKKGGPNANSKTGTK